MQSYDDTRISKFLENRDKNDSKDSKVKELLGIDIMEVYTEVIQDIKSRRKGGSK